LLSGLFGTSPEDQYAEAQKRNLQRSIQAIRVNSQIRRARAQREAHRQIALATQAGSRRAAFQGSTADPSVFTDPDTSRITGSLTEALTGIGEQEQGDIANATAGVRDLPSYSFPHATDYLSSALGTASGIINTGEETDWRRKMEEDRQKSQDAMFGALKYSGGMQDLTSGLDEDLRRQRQNRMRL
jgi:hypothetical protein